MKAIEEAEKAEIKETESEEAHIVEQDQVANESKGEILETKTEDFSVAEVVQEAEPSLSSNQDWLKKYKALATEKEKALNEKINADRSALGLALKEELAQIELEIAEVENDTEEFEELVVEEDSKENISEEEDIAEAEKLKIQQVPAVEEQVIEHGAAAEENTETIVKPLKIESVEDPEITAAIVSASITVESDRVKTHEGTDIEGAISTGVSRSFFITPAKRYYTNREVDFNSIQDRRKRRLIQRMLAEDRGRLAVLKNVHNSRIDLSNDKGELAWLNANIRNQEVLAGFELAQARFETIAENGVKVNWFDRGLREGIIYRLALSFKLSSVSDRILEAMAPLIEANFEMPRTSLNTGYHTKLADARSEFLEYRSRGYSNIEIRAFENGDQIPLIEVMNKAVIEN